MNDLSKLTDQELRDLNRSYQAMSELSFKDPDWDRIRRMLKAIDAEFERRAQALRNSAV